MNSLADSSRPILVQQLDMHDSDADFAQLASLGMHVFLFGPAGSGKRTRARALLAWLSRVEPNLPRINHGIYQYNNFMEVDCRHADLCAKELQALVQANMRRVRHFFGIIFSFAEYLSEDMQDRLRKDLEEMQGNRVYVFCASHSGALSEALRSRCCVWGLSLPSDEWIKKQARRRIAEKKLQVSEALLTDIARESKGDYRQVLARIGSLCYNDKGETRAVASERRYPWAASPCLYRNALQMIQTAVYSEQHHDLALGLDAALDYHTPCVVLLDLCRLFWKMTRPQDKARLYALARDMQALVMSVPRFALECMVLSFATEFEAV